MTPQDAANQIGSAMLAALEMLAKETRVLPQSRAQFALALQEKLEPLIAVAELQAPLASTVARLGAHAREALGEADRAQSKAIDEKIDRMFQPRPIEP